MPWTVTPRKWSPWTVHGRIIGPLGPNCAAIPGPPAADCALFTITFAIVLAYAYSIKHDEATGGGDDTIPIEEELA